MLLYRNILSTPGLNPRQFLKAQDVGADMGVINLEDPVPPERKTQARGQALRFFTQPRHLFYGLQLNTLRSAHGSRDLAALVDSEAQPEMVILSKIESPEELRIADEVLSPRLPNLRLGVVIESLRGLWAVHEIAHATPRLAAFLFGAADCAAELGVEVNWDSLLHARSRLVMAAASAGIASYDAPYFNLRDMVGLAAECRAARQLGFTGKLSIHPGHLDTINAEFSPTPRAVEHARRVIAACEQKEGGIAVVDGQMVGPPFVAMAQRILAAAEEAAKVRREPVLAG